MQLLILWNLGSCRDEKWLSQCKGCLMCCHTPSSFELLWEARESPSPSVSRATEMLVKTDSQHVSHELATAMTAFWKNNSWLVPYLNTDFQRNFISENSIYWPWRQPAGGDRESPTKTHYWKTNKQKTQSKFTNIGHNQEAQKAEFLCLFARILREFLQSLKERIILNWRLIKDANSQLYKMVPRKF